MKRTFEFLKALEKEIQPPLGQHHSLTFGEHGSNAGGWTEKLVLNIRRHNGSQNYLLDTTDMERPTKDLVNMIAEIEADRWKAIGG